MPSSYWLNGSTYEGENVEVFRYQPPKEGGVQPSPISAEIRYAATSSWEAKYDGEGAVVYRKEKKSTPWGDTYAETFTEYSNSYGVERVIATTYVYGRRESITQACGFPPYAVAPLPGDIIAAGGSGTTLVEKLVSVSTAQEESVINTEYRSAAAILTSDGAAAIQMYIRSYTDLYEAAPKSVKEEVVQALRADVSNIIRWASQIKPDKTRVQYSKKRKDQSLKEAVGGGAPDPNVAIGAPPPGVGGSIDDDTGEIIEGPGTGDLLDEPDPDDGYTNPEPTEPEIDFETEPVFLTGGNAAVISERSRGLDVAVIKVRGTHNFTPGQEVLVLALRAVEGPDDPTDEQLNGTHIVDATPSDSEFSFPIDSQTFEGYTNYLGVVVATDSIKKTNSVDKYFASAGRMYVYTVEPHGLVIGDNVLIFNEAEYSPAEDVLIIGYWRVSGILSSTLFAFEWSGPDLPSIDDPQNRCTIITVGYGSPSIPSDPSLPTDPSDPIYPPWPTDPDGDLIPWPTDPDGNPLPFDPGNPAFDPWNDGGDPTIPLDPGGVPTIPLDPGGYPIYPDPTDPDAPVYDPGFPFYQAGGISYTQLTDNVATITTKGDHGFSIGTVVQIQCTTDADYRGTFTIIGTPTARKFTYKLVSTDKPLIASSGTVVRPEVIENTNLITRTQVTNNVAKITTESAHGLTIGDNVLVQCTPDKAFEGYWSVTGTPSANIFTFKVEMADKAVAESGGRVLTIGYAPINPPTLPPGDPDDPIFAPARSGVVATTQLSNNVATITTEEDHYFSIGDIVLVQCTTDATYIGTHKIRSTPSSTQFTYKLEGSDLPSAASRGTVIRSDSIEKTNSIIRAKVASNVATIVTEQPHELSINDNVLLQCTTDPDYEGAWRVIGVPSQNSFTFELVVADKPVADSAGTVVTIGYRLSDPDFEVPPLPPEVLDPPYPPDDEIILPPGDDLELPPGDELDVIDNDAKQKALEYMRIQTALRLGYNRGQSVVYPVEYYRSAPFSPLYISIKGITGQCRSDSSTITFDSTGILVSTNALFWGGVGQ